MENTHMATAESVEQSFWQALRPDPVPPPPAWMTDLQRGAWLQGAREGIALGRELERQEREGQADG